MIYLAKETLKYEFLLNNSIESINYKKLPCVAPNYFFVNKSFDEEKKYEKGFKINNLLKLNTIGIVTARDNFTIHETISEVKNTIETFLSLDDESARIKFNLGKDVRDWQVNFAKKDLQNHYPNDNRFVKLAYRPFDNRYTFYTGKSKGFHCYPRNEVMQHFLSGINIGLVIGKQCVDDWKYIFISKLIGEFNLTGTAGRFGSGNYFPLYLYPKTTDQQNAFETGKRVPNLNMEIVNDIEKALGLSFIPELEDRNLCSANNTEVRLDYRTTFAPIHLLDYIYAVLHSPSYRVKYKEFLKIDFPRVPYPTDIKTFWKLVELGGQLREIHLLESPTVEKYITQYPEDGDNIVTKPRFEQRVLVDEDNVISHNFVQEPMGRVHINDKQFFENVPEVAWNFYIGGYQPAQKWLKDRKDRELSYEDILHHQKIIVALTETVRLMKEIDKVLK